MSEVPALPVLYAPGVEANKLFLRAIPSAIILDLESVSPAGAILRHMFLEMSVHEATLVCARLADMVAEAIHLSIDKELRA